MLNFTPHIVNTHILDHETIIAIINDVIGPLYDFCPVHVVEYKTFGENGPFFTPMSNSSHQKYVNELLYEFSKCYRILSDLFAKFRHV